MKKTKTIKKTIKMMKRIEKRKKAIVKIFSSDKMPKGIKKEDLMASIRGYNQKFSTYREHLNNKGYTKAVTKKEKKMNKALISLKIL